VNKKDPNFLTSFEDGNQQFVIEQELKTLSTTITNCKTDNIRLKEKFIKSALLHLVNHLIKKKTPVTTHISSECIIIHPNDRFSIQIVTNDDPNAQNMMPGASNAVYEAPEVLNNDNPDSRALVWSVGCILHEALALEPAFHDTSGTNPFQVYMNITNGVIPPTPSDGSEELQNLLEKCLIHNRGSRISLNELKEALSKS
jgi:serine/threonine protein kinase